MTYNRTCAYCGDRYYVCNKCVDIKSWKNICCSAACFRNLASTDSPLAPKVLSMTRKNVMRAGLPGGKTIDITGYDMELGRFDCTDGVTRLYSDFEYFLVPKDEFTEIGERLCLLTETVKDAKLKEPVKEEMIEGFKEALAVSQGTKKFEETEVKTKEDIGKVETEKKTEESKPTPRNRKNK